MRILITGSRGFIGGSLGRHAAAGHEVLGISRASQPEPDWPGAHEQADVAYADLSSVIKNFAPDVIFHGAGSASVGGSYSDPSADLHAAAMTFANMLSSVKRTGMRPVIFFPSSAAVYGNPSELPVKENAPTNPMSPYGFHKAACELIAREYALCFEFRIVVGRIFSLFGPRQRRLLVWEIYKQLKANDLEITLQGTGKETRDYLSIDDFSRAFLSIAAETVEKKESSSQIEIFNLAGGTATEVQLLAEKIMEISGRHKSLRCLGEDRVGDPAHWQASTQKLANFLPDFVPSPLDQGLRKCIDEWNATAAEHPRPA